MDRIKQNRLDNQRDNSTLDQTQRKRLMGTTHWFAFVSGWINAAEAIDILNVYARIDEANARFGFPQ